MSERIRWQRVEEIFAWVIGREPSSRAEELASRCGGDGALQDEVASLVAAWESSVDFLETPATRRIALAADENDPRRGARIGRYQLVRPIGRGGMGVVYEAWQDDPRRAVALKIVRGGALADPMRIRRFQREAESLGRLDHPGIARIFEAGLDAETGDHWFAMELVRGRPLAEWASTEAPPRRVVLELFARICDAVEHAHRQGVVHRDLKPSNVLVVGEGDEPLSIKVLDFGLAHCSAAEDAAITRLTEPGRVFGTLSYMSPEQARGEPDSVGPSSDVYSLGVILYELVTGKLPLDVEGVSLPQAVLCISERQPELAGRIDRALRGDLETIAAKAMEKEPARRYATASALARDVERHLAGQPIEARPPSMAYQAHKLVLRHKLFFGAALFACVLFAAAAVVSGVLYARARAAEQRARVEAQTALAISAFLQEMLASAEPGTRASHELSVREVLDRAAQNLEREPAALAEVGAALHATIGEAYRGLGLFDRAQTHIEAALAVDRGRSGGEASLARDLAALGRVRLEQGRYAECEELSSEAVAILRRAGPSDRLVEVLIQLASAVRLRADSASAVVAARALYEEALAIVQTLPEDCALTANTWNEYAGLLAAEGDDAGAESHYRRALDLHVACYGEVNVRVAQDQNDLAIVLARGESLDEAIALTRRALETYERILGPEHPTTAAVMNNLGSLLVRGEEVDEGEALLLDALALRRRLLGDDHPDVARTLQLLGFAAHGRGELARAEECFTEALAINRARFGPNHLEVGNGESNLALVSLDAGRPDAALEHARAALDVYRVVLPANHIYLPQSEALLGRVLLALGRPAEAQTLFASALASLEDRFDERDPAVERARRELAALHEQSAAR